MTTLPTPHLEKLNATLENDKLPRQDKSRIEAAVKRYQTWVRQLGQVSGNSNDETVARMVALLNEYRMFLDVEIIFDSQQDFLYRQKGQLKLDNSVLEEFLPHLVSHCQISGLDLSGIELGPMTAFSAVYFTSGLDAQLPGGGLHVRTKNQDFAIGKRLFLQASHDQTFREAVSRDFFLGYVVAECKTNLDKTMFQEACATAHDTKSAVTGAKYYLLCEWLDMTPQSTVSTDIDEVLILRKAKRMNSNVRSAFGTAAGRKSNRQAYINFLSESPFHPEMFSRLVAHISSLLNSDPPDEDDVLNEGYF